MYRHDSISKTLCKYRFNLYRGDELIEDYLEKYLDSYYNDIKCALDGNNSYLGDEIVELIKKELPTLKKICQDIPKILRMFSLGDYINAENESLKLFDSMYNYLIVGLMENEEVFYRIRENDFRIKEGDSKEKKKELFHIPFKLRSRIGAYRYSTAGVPCLYLAGDKELAWYECGMPQKFSYCQMKFSTDEEGVRLLNFSLEPIDFLSNYYCALINSKRKNNIDKVKYYSELLLKYIISYPLVISCSMKVKDKSVKFVEEYIMPQLLMQWIKASNKIDGIVYKSSLYSSLVDGLGAKNIVFPVKEYREDGLDKQLTEKLSISDIGFVDVSKVFEKYQKSLVELDNFIKKIKLMRLESNFPYLDYQMIDFCNCVIQTYEAIMNNNFNNFELLFKIIGNLNDHFELFYDQRDNIIQNQIYSRKQYFDSNADLHKIKEDELALFNELKNLISKILKKHMVYDFEFEVMNNYEKI